MSPRLQIRVTRLEEQDLKSTRIDMSRLSDDELKDLSNVLTRDSLREELKREPTEAEIQQREEETQRYYAGLSLQQLIALKKGDLSPLRRPS